MVPPLHYGRSWILALFGATVGAFLDYLHTHGGAIVYPEGTNHWRGILTFMVVYWFGGTTFAMWNHSAKNPCRPKPYRSIAPHLLLYCVMYALTAYADWNSWVVAGILFSAALWSWQTLEGGTWQGLLGAVVAGICGASTEAILSHYETMSYTVQDYGKVPVWLPMIYFQSALTFGQGCRRVLTRHT